MTGTLRRFASALAASCALAATGCGGDSATPAPGGISLTTRAAAALLVAQADAACTGIQPFYWEIGDKTGVQASGTATTTGATAPAATTQMLIASASKWLFGAYVVQLRSGQLSASELQALTMRSGYTNLQYTACLRLVRANQDAETVHQCFTNAHLTGTGTNADQDPSVIGLFDYNGGHFQWLSDSVLGLGGASNATLQSAIASQLGADFTFTYDSPQLAAGVQTSGADYGAFLRKVLGGSLLIGNYLGTSAVCTNPSTCAQAAYTPIPSSESWHYSLAHWVEDDAAMGDGAFSSPGAFGFYPWIDASKTWYGVLARKANSTIGSKDPVAVDSVNCGRRIRKAWLTGAAP
jgi:hypothetical protein